MNQQADLAEDVAADLIRLLLREMGWMGIAYADSKLVAGNAIREELLLYLQDISARLTDDGRPAVVHNGYHQQREFLTPLGNLAVQVPNVRSRDEQQAVFRSALVPPYVRRSQTLDVALP